MPPDANIIERINERETTRKSQWGLVVALGRQFPADVDVRVGDLIVLFKPWGGSELTIGDDPHIVCKTDHVGLVIRG